MKSLFALSLLIVLSMILSTPAFAQSISSTSTTASVETVSGTSYRGQIVRETPDTVFLITSDGNSMSLLRKNITSIDYHSSSVTKNFWEVGGALGTPAGFDLIAGYHWSHVGVRLAFGYWGAVSGVEVSVPITLSRTEHTSQDIAISAWTSSLQTTETTFDFYGNPYPATVQKTFTGIGPAYQVNLSGFSGELGLTFGSGTFSSPQAMIQLGYVYQFR